MLIARRAQHLQLEAGWGRSTCLHVTIVIESDTCWITAGQVVPAAERSAPPPEVIGRETSSCLLFAIIPLRRQHPLYLEVQGDGQERLQQLLVVRSLQLFQGGLKLKPALLEYQADLCLGQLLINAKQAALVLVLKSLHHRQSSCAPCKLTAANGFK